MPIYLPESLSAPAESLTPRQIVAELDKYVVGQHKAKRAVAIALRNRMRRQKLSPEMAEEVAPKNILMIGPTGVGKTEIARRLARLAQSPFLKVEASKFTEVGYVGRDVESMVRDLVEIAVDMVREERIDEVQAKAERNAEERLLDLLLPPAAAAAALDEDPAAAREQAKATREKMRDQLREGRLDDRDGGDRRARALVPVVRDHRRVVGRGSGHQHQGHAARPLPGADEEAPGEGVRGDGAPAAGRAAEARGHGERGARSRWSASSRRASSSWTRSTRSRAARGAHGPDVSREGVQRDILPIIEGTTVNTKYGMVQTDHILFIAAGAFHVSKPSDLIPELQGRFPIRVELEPLGKDDFVRILTEPQNALVKQYTALLETEGIALDFRADAVERIADFATLVNERAENIGARRLHTVMEKLLDEISFEAPDLAREIDYY